MEKTGEVTAVHGDWLEVTFCRPSDCEKCRACGDGPKKATIKVKGKANLGDTAVVSLPTQTVLKASMLAYAAPLAGLLIGMFAGLELFPASPDVAPLIGGLIGVIIPMVVIKVTEKTRQKSAAWKPTLVKVIPKNIA